jgi:hypothetical protein
MTAAPDSRSSAERVDDIDRIQFEISEAVREALAAHRRAGNPVAIWRNDRVEWIPANEIPDDVARESPDRSER